MATYCAICDKRIQSEEEYVDMYRGICIDCYESLPRCYICEEKMFEDDMYEIYNPSEDNNVYICYQCIGAYTKEWNKMIEKLKKGGE